MLTGSTVRKSILVTGGAGFVGQSLISEWLDQGARVTAGIHSKPLQSGLADVHVADLRDEDQVAELFDLAKPEIAYHLAARSHVGESWKDPVGTMSDNVTITARVLDAASRLAPNCRVVIASTGEVYGPPQDLPVKESHPLAPQNPYAVSKQQVEDLVHFYATTRSLDTVIVRSFSHAGPGQSPIYLISNIARQVAKAVLDRLDRVVVRTGSGKVARDYTDVRDAARAYRLLGTSGVSGPINVASGIGRTTESIVSMVAGGAPIEVVHEVSAELVRHNEVQEIRGSTALMRTQTGWRPEIEFEQTVLDSYKWWIEALKADPGFGEGLFG